VARRHGVAPNQLFTWRRLVAQGSLTAAGSGEEASATSATKSASSSHCPFIHAQTDVRLS
jgi:transposase-like protein